jgi:hypothetical protein
MTSQEDDVLLVQLVHYYIMGSAPEHRVPFTVIMAIGVMLILITSKIVGLINKNTTVILRAIADIERQVRIQYDRRAVHGADHQTEA